MIKRNTLLKGFTVVFLLFILGGGWWMVRFTPVLMEQYTIMVDTTPITVEVAQSSSQRRRGLSGRESLAPDHGMLFVMPTEERHSFWMKDMKFPIDMIWIDERGTIVDILHDVTPDSYPTLFRSTVPVQFILETKSGFSKKNSIDIGDFVVLPMAK